LELRKKSLTDLRSIAMGFGVDDVFSKDANQLAQAIELKQEAMIPEPPVAVPMPQYDARLMTKIPSKKATREEVEELLREHVARGLNLSFTDEMWHISQGRKTDEGTLRMPLRHILKCANAILS
jgi:hypothetical protein